MNHHRIRAHESCCGGSSCESRERTVVCSRHVQLCARRREKVDDLRAFVRVTYIYTEVNIAVIEKREAGSWRLLPLSRVDVHAPMLPTSNNPNSVVLANRSR